MSRVLRAYLFQALMQHETAKKVLEPIARRLRTGNSADTVDRLFSSAHVNDLRLITAVTCIVFVWLTLFAFVTAIIAAILDWGPQAFRIARGDFLLLFAPAITALAGILTWAYQAGSARLGVVDLFACEIDTLCRVVAVTDMVRRQTDRYNRRSPETSSADDHSDGSRNSFSSEENYFPILDSNARDLQSLEAEVVVNITAFYTYMKAVRDSLRMLAEIRPMSGESPAARTSRSSAESASLVQPWHDAMRNAMYVLYLALESGRHAIRDLVEFEPDQTERTIVILISELSAYRFLREQYRNPSDMHYSRLILRGPEYQELVPRLCDLVHSQKPAALAAVQRGGALRDESQDSVRAARLWLSAFQLLGELRKRYDELVAAFPLECVTNGELVVAERKMPPTLVA
jgi:hypothetical protein